eukprot:m51a1_g8458 hypothetical protein (263) ;mRNA; r:422367-423523
MSAAAALSLVRYDDPVEAGPAQKDRRRGKGAAANAAAAGSNAGPSGTSGAAGAGKTAGGRGDDSSGSGQVSDILNAIIPPREFKENNQMWIQYASEAPATRTDVVALQKELDKRLADRKAREVGICPVRQELYSQCFDEIIRQVTLNCVERGLLLTRVRDEQRMTIKCYQTLYESSIAFGIRKALEAEQGKTELEQRIMNLEGEKRDLERQVAELKTKCEFIEKRENERRTHEEKKHGEEVAFLKRTNMQLKTQLESILKKT